MKPMRPVFTVIASAVALLSGNGAALAVPAWTIQTTPNPVASPNWNSLNAVSCKTTSACTAVGYFQPSSTTYSPLAARWNGTSWATQAVPLPVGVTQGILTGVSCATATACTAVGYSPTTGGDLALAERWNGTSWAVKPVPKPAGGSNFSLSEVSCTAANACTAVGYYQSGTAYVPWAVRWNGTKWVTQTTQKPTGSTVIILESVSCASATACTAVGYYLNASSKYVTLAEHWNGTTWSIQTTVNPVGATDSELLGVSCKTTVCTAVGYFKNSGGTFVTLAERWNGTTWALQTTPNGVGATTSSLNSVSCASASVCTATGSFKNSGGAYFTLAEKWNGTNWVRQTTPNPVGSTTNIFYGVSCLSGVACFGVGVSDDGAGHRRTLAERYA